MDVHQFIGDLITSGSTLKDQPDVLNATWGMAAAAAAVGFKGLLEPLPQPPPRPAPDSREAEAGRQVQPGAAQRKGGTRDRGRDGHHACTCPGCPSSTSPPSLEALKPRQPLSSPPNSNAGSQSKEPNDASSAAASEPKSRPPRQDPDRVSQSPEQTPESPLPTAASGPLSHLSALPCLCCHRTQILSQHEATDSPLSRAHHHHFHHHHCPIASCFPCPQLAPSHPSQLSGTLPCLSCQHSVPTCAQVCHHQHRAAHQEAGRVRTASTTLSLHPCMHCAASFSRPSQLLQHQRSEHAHKPSGFLCTECGRAFNSHSNLRIHFNVHTGARPYTCSDCGKSFSQSGALKIHRRIHTGERPYSCGFCGRGFPHLAGVRAHQRTHTGEKPYRCNQCGKCFTQSGALKIHTRIHTGERPFICSLCGKGFSNRSGIRFHYRTVHGLAADHAVDSGIRDACQAPAGRGYSPGRPRNFPSANIGLITPNSPDNNSHAASNSRDSPAPTAAQVEGAKPGGNKEGLPYACEDCGLRFKDAPSRNRHQTLMHYSSEVREDEEGGPKERLNTTEGVQSNSRF
ncbi:zinc finger protein 135 isoform X2 [Betta splendens]|nr:zinc finger protein 135 isoform X2 [Betta splendens]